MAIPFNDFHCILQIYASSLNSGGAMDKSGAAGGGCHNKGINSPGAVPQLPERKSPDPDFANNRLYRYTAQASPAYILKRSYAKRRKT